VSEFPPPNPHESVEWRWSGIAIGAGTAIAFWMAAFVIGAVLSGIALVATGYGTTAQEDLPTWATAVSVVGLWVPFVVMVTYSSRAYGSGRLVRDLVARVKPAHFVGVAIGVASQLIVVPVVTIVASKVAPSLFDYSKLEDRAHGLVDQANGGWVLLLLVVVALGAPIVEEMTYRGFLQGSLRRSMDPRVALVVVAALFAGVHFSVIEFPGLFAFALILGVCFEKSKGLALPIITHMAFNATAIVLMTVVK
jgi:membrane protease YdiL (CAAX protease family)